MQFTNYFSKMGYFSITVYIKGRKRPLHGIRHYPNISTESVRQLSYRELMKFYVRTDITKIDVIEVNETSPEVQTCLKRRIQQ
ncbi:MAG: hypothetical protein QM764_09475 [Chitinophagaceae bacterium]